MRAVMFDPGRLTARLTLEKPVATPDGQGGAATVFQAAGACWALIEPVAMPRTDEAAQMGFTVTHRVHIRHRGDLAAGQRFRKGSRLFSIVSFRDPDETGRMLVCACEEIGR